MIKAKGGIPLRNRVGKGHVSTPLNLTLRLTSGPCAIMFVIVVLCRRTVKPKKLVVFSALHTKPNSMYLLTHQASNKDVFLLRFNYWQAC